MMAKDFIGNEITVGCNVVYSGQRHHRDGLAAQWADVSKSWHIMGKPLSETRFLAKTR
jgi:hypothetical protein